MKKWISLLVFLGMAWVVNSYAEGEKKMANDQTHKLEKATFAGGCFWCMQPFYDSTPGVVSTLVGYTGGFKDNPTYEEVCTGTTGHTEAVEVLFDPTLISYEKILDIFWRQIDPTTVNQQFADQGTQYRTGIFYHSQEQKRVAELSKKKLQASHLFDKPIVTEITAATKFWPAEEYHQKYYIKNTSHYKAYRQGSGRQDFIEKKWGKESYQH